MRDFLHRLILPHPSNNHKASLLHPRVFILSILFFLTSAVFLPGNLRTFAEISYNELVSLTNQKRAESGLSPVSLNSQLSVAAQKKAEDMFAKNYWAHNSPDGLTPWFFIRQAGYSYTYAGENLARGFTSANDVVNAWMASPSHRANLLSGNYRHVGFAVRSGKLNGEDTTLVVQELGSQYYAPVAKKNTKTKAKTPKSTKVLSLNVAPLSLSLSQKIAFGVVLSFILVFAIDIIVLNKKRIVRFTGHNVDHMIFLAGILGIIILFGRGAIL